MPTFTAIALDRLLEPGTSKPIDMSLPKPKPSSSSNHVSNSKLQRRNSTSVAERKVQRPQIKPALYATPETTPLPDSPSSFPPSPYIINHKRRGPRLLKSFSEVDVSLRQKGPDEEKPNLDTQDLETDVVKPPEDKSDTFPFPQPIKDKHVNGDHGYGSSTVQLATDSNVHPGSINCQLGSHNGDHRKSETSNGLVVENDSLKLVTPDSKKRVVESDDFFDPQDSLSYTSNGEESSAEYSRKPLNTPTGEFYDAWEELSSESGLQPSHRDVEAEMREMRLSLLMEIEKRKQAEEALNSMQSQWQRYRQQLSLVGLTFPADPTVVAEGEQHDSGPVEDLCRQVYLARFVSDSIGRGTARAEMEIEMKAQIDSKNFEIARLCDRLHYYEAVNHEMSQRNQEVVEIARRERLRRKRRQRWIWGSVAAALTLGTAALAWSYFPSERGSSLSSHSHASERDDAAK